MQKECKAVCYERASAIHLGVGQSTTVCAFRLAREDRREGAQPPTPFYTRL